MKLKSVLANSWPHLRLGPSSGSRGRTPLRVPPDDASTSDLAPYGSTGRQEGPSVVDSNLSSRSVRGAAALAASQAGVQVASLVVKVILARLLLPREFGVIGLTYLVVNFLTIVNDFGLATAAVQTRRLNDGTLRVLFWLNLLSGVLLAAACFAVSSAVARFYREPVLAGILRWLSPVFVLASLPVLHKAVLKRSFKFFRVAVIEFVGTLCLGVAAIAAAWGGAGAGSIVWGLLAGQVVLALAYPLTTRVSLRGTVDGSDRRAALDVARRSLQVLLIRVVSFVLVNGDYVIVGRFLGSTALGLYTLAYSLTTFPVTRFAPVVFEVALASFTSVTDQEERVRRGYLRMVAMVNGAMLPLVVLIGATAQWSVPIVFGDRWLGAVPVMWGLLVAAVGRTFVSGSDSVLLARGKNNLVLVLAICKLPLLAGALAIGARHGIVGVAMGVSAFVTVGFLATQWVTNKALGIRWHELRVVSPALRVSVVVVGWVAAIALLRAWTGLPAWAALAGSVGLAAPPYLLQCWRTFRPVLVSR